MQIALCNEVLGDLPLVEQCRVAAALGYCGLEIAPYTLAEDPTRLTDAQIAAARRVVEDHGLVVTGLHWLLVAPKGLSITSPDPAVQAATHDALAALVDLCAGLGGRVLVHGSPKQRLLGGDPEAARERAVARFAAVAEQAAAAGVTYCIEPISSDEADFINTVAEAAAIVDRIASPALRTMIDTGHAARDEAAPVADLAARWLPGGRIAHFQVNDRNRGGPGQGDDRFAPFLRVLRDAGWPHPLAVEPLRYVPDGPGCAARSIGYLRGVIEGMAEG